MCSFYFAGMNRPLLHPIIPTSSPTKTMQNRKIKPLSWQCMYLSRTGYQADCWIQELCLQWLKTKLVQNKKEGSMTQTGHMDRHDTIIYLSKLADSRSISSCSLIVCPEMYDIPYSAYWQPEQRH